MVGGSERKRGEGEGEGEGEGGREGGREKKRGSEGERDRGRMRERERESSLFWLLPKLKQTQATTFMLKASTSSLRRNTSIVFNRVF